MSQSAIPTTPGLDRRAFLTRTAATAIVISSGALICTREAWGLEVKALKPETARTLIVHGDRDPLYPVELALEMYRAIRSSALWVVPNGGHGPVFGPLAAPFVETALAHLKSAG